MSDFHGGVHSLFPGREICLDAPLSEELADVVGELVQKTVSVPSYRLEHTEIATDIEHNNALIPSEMQRVLRGTRFFDLAVTVSDQGRAGKSVNVIGTDLERPDRTVSFRQLPNDSSAFRVVDSHAREMERYDRRMEKFVDRGGLMVWLTAQAMDSMAVAQRLTWMDDEVALQHAAQLLQAKVAAKQVIQIAGLPFPNGDMLHAQLNTYELGVQEREREEDAVPLVRRSTAWLSKRYEGANLTPYPANSVPDATQWIAEKWLASFCPEAGITEPLEERITGSSTVAEPSSVRVIIEASPNSDPNYLPNYMACRALEGETNIIEMFKAAATEVNELNP